jgi:hypothetical protein
MDHVIEELRKALPPVFAGTSLSELTGGAIHWPTIQNRRALRQIPDDCFVRSGPRVLVLRDEFLNWWATTLSDARRPDSRQPRRRRDGANRAITSESPEAA